MLSKEEIEISYIEVPIPLNPEELEREYRDLYIRHKILLGEKQNIIEKLEKKIRYYEENDEILATSNDNYSDGTVIKKFIDEFREILSILKGE